MNGISDEQRSKTWLMYLRKSRQDNPDETVEEVLAKHETILQEWAMRELGHEIPDDCIYREIVSGESISERVRIQKVLARVEDPSVTGVVCVDPQRLSRGDLLDCGTLINTLMYSNTLVATPMMTYDLTNKMERRFFQDELMRGRDYLEYVKEVLIRGRVASIKRGCFIGNRPPFGYDKVVIGKDHTLVPNQDADIVRMIFDWYVNEGIGYGEISNRLDDLGVKPVYTDFWNRATIARMLQNVHYDGKVCFYRKKTVVTVKDGQKKTSTHLQPEEDVIVVEGKHPAIVDHDIFMAAQEKINNHPRRKKDYTLRNPWAGLLRCSTCGRSLIYHMSPRGKARLECNGKPAHFKTVYCDVVEEAILFALENSELPNLEAKRDENAGNSIAIQQNIIKRLEEELQGYREQEETQYELLETRKYTQELFDKRNSALRQKMTDCEQRIKKARASLPQAVDYDQKIIQLRSAIEAVKDPSRNIEEANRLLKTIIDRIVVTVTGEKRNENNIGLQIFLRL